MRDFDYTFPRLSSSCYVEVPDLVIRCFVPYVVASRLISGGWFRSGLG